MTDTDSLRDVDAIIVTYNSAGHIRACLDRLPAQLPVTVIDNASRDDTREIVGNYPAVTLHALPENVGFARAVNHVAARTARKYILILNPDTEVPETSLVEIVSLLEQNPDHAIIGGAGLDGDGRFLRNSAFDAPTVWSVLAAALGLRAVFRSSRLFDPQSIEPAVLARTQRLIPADCVTGACMAIRRSDWQQLEGFDERFFMYGEDVDLCERARQVGRKTGVATGATFYHRSGASARSFSSMMSQIFRADITNARRHGSRALAATISPLLHLHVATRVLALLAVSAVRPRYRAQLRDWQDTWRNRQAWRKGY